jgi:hypothetical protein
LVAHARYFASVETSVGGARENLLKKVWIRRRRSRRDLNQKKEKIFIAEKKKNGPYQQGIQETIQIFLFIEDYQKKTL